MYLEREARLRRAVPALGAARRLVREGARALKVIARDIVGDGLERASVVRACDAVGAVGAAIEQRFEMHSGNGSIALHTRAHPHQRGVAPAMTVENLFACQRDFHWPARDHGKLRHRNLVIERIALAAKAPAVWRRNDANPRGRQLQHLGERAVDVMRRLRRGPERQLAVGGPHRDGRVLFHRQVRIAFEEEQILPHEIGCRDAVLDVAELEVDQLVEIAAIGVVVNLRLGMRDRGFGRVEGLERLVDHLDEIERGGRCLFGGRSHGSDRIADKPDLVETERVLVLGDGQNPERNRQIGSRQYRLHAV